MVKSKKMINLRIPEEIWRKISFHAKRNNMEVEDLVVKIINEELQKYKLCTCSICEGLIEPQYTVQCHECDEWLCCGYIKAKERHKSYVEEGHREENENATIICYRCLISQANSPDYTHPSEFSENHEVWGNYIVERNFRAKSDRWEPE
ncbi:MAG: hypothetical protein ACFFBD_20625 [Candidatus Hodarchaeota archaeon]